MTSEDHNTYLEWLYLESDDQLTPGQQGRLREHLESCGSCREEQLSIAAMNRLIGQATMPVRADFRAGVMGAIQPAGWDSKSPRTWVAAAILLALLMSGATLLTGLNATGNTPAFGPLAAASAAVVDLFKTSALAGAGLLSASWRGLGLAFSTLLSGSRWTAVSFIIFVVGIDLLLLRLLLRPKGYRSDPVAARSNSGSTGTPGSSNLRLK
jgi:anti-sigma factor RsiW